MDKFIQLSDKDKRAYFEMAAADLAALTVYELGRLGPLPPRLPR